MNLDALNKARLEFVIARSQFLVFEECGDEAIQFWQKELDCFAEIDVGDIADVDLARND